MIKNYFLSAYYLILLLAVISSCKKGGSSPKTTLEILSQNWKISRVTINGILDNTGNYSGYKAVLQQNGTYVITLGNSPVNIVINPTNSGRWAITDNETSITFDQGTPNEFKVTLVSKSETTFTVNFKVPQNINKTQPQYTIDFVLAN